MDKRRVSRVGQAIREELSQLISFEMSDPRVKSVTVAEVDVSPDGRQASVKVELFGSPEEQSDAMDDVSRALPARLADFDKRAAARGPGASM